MGCDIHLYKEKQVDGKWVTADEWSSYNHGEEDKGIEVPWQKRFTERNYELFGLLSKGVRTEHEFSFEPRDMPVNACKEVFDESERWGGDGHGHSYLYLHELKDMLAHLNSNTIRISGMKDKEGLAKLRESIASGKPNWDLLFPYCGWANSPNYEAFEIDVPASFYMGGSLQKIIDSFDGVDGDNHRIVFWFDN